VRGLICDDHPLMRDALVSTIQDRWPDLVLESAGDFPSAWALAANQPDFCLVDLSMPGASPAAGVAGVRAAAPNAVMLVLTGLTDAALLKEVQASRLAAVLSKDSQVDDLIDALCEAVPAMRAMEAARLPDRQQQVLSLLSEGLTNKEIARRLEIAPATVKIHVARLSSWLGAVNRTDAVARAQRARLI
jgi:DNA-binding NarL/FixJ family response regulator